MSLSPIELISSRLNQLNSILYGISLKHTSRLHRIQRAAARVVCTSNVAHIHCLQLRHSIGSQWSCLRSYYYYYYYLFAIKTHIIMYISWCNGVYGLNLPPWPSKPCNTGRPPCLGLSDLLQHHEPTRSLRLSSSHQLSLRVLLLTVWSEVQVTGIWSTWCHYHLVISCHWNPEWLNFLMPCYPDCPGKQAVNRVSRFLSVLSAVQCNCTYVKWTKNSETNEWSLTPVESYNIARS